MKHLYVFTFAEIKRIAQFLNDAKRILDQDSPVQLAGCKAAIDEALRELMLDIEGWVWEAKE